MLLENIGATMEAVRKESDQMQSAWRSLGLASVLSFSFIASDVFAAPIDVTRLVLAATDVQQQLSDNCGRLAMGNEKNCSLERATIDSDPARHLIILDAILALKSRHQPVRGFIAYDDTAHVTVHAEINDTTCALASFDARSSNDIYAALLSVFSSELRQQLVQALPQCQHQ